MKKVLAVILAIAVVCSIGVVSVFAYRKHNNNYIDTDNNGICDNRETCSYTDIDNNGVCDNRSTGKNYVDEDNDGVCDNRGEGKGKHCGGNRVNYIDSNNNGVCNNRE